MSPDLTKVNGKEGMWSTFKTISLGSIIVFVLHALGFLTTTTFAVRLRIPSGFLPESPTEYLLWGAKALTVCLGVFLINFIVLSIILILVKLVWQFPRLMFRRLDNLILSLKERMELKIQNIFKTHINSLAGILFILALLAFLTFFVSFSDLIFATYISSESTQLLSPDSGAYLSLYFFTLGIILTVSCVCLYKVHHLQILQNANVTFSKIFKLATIGLIFFEVVFLVSPYRLRAYNEFERILFEDKRAYILVEKDLQYVIYLPNCITLVVSSNDIRVQRSQERIYENIFKKEP